MNRKITLLALSLLTLATAFGQKTYMIGNVAWKFKKPAGYITRIDNFATARKTGDSILTQDYKQLKLSTDDAILFSVAKSDSIDLNVIFGSRRADSSIARFTLKGYMDKLLQLLRSNNKKQDPDATTILKELTIDHVHFFLIESNIHNREADVRYWTRIYVADIAGQELNISVTYDNAKDRAAIETAILGSQFIFPKSSVKKK